jgi:hypothetical protein
MAVTNFYTHKNKEKAELCKACQTAHIDNWDPETFLWLLKEYDVPWIEPEWNVLRDRAWTAAKQKNPNHPMLTGMSVFGKYLSKMKLKQWNKYNWDDTEMLKEQREAERLAAENGVNTIEEEKIAEMKEAYERGEITEAQYQTYAEIHAPEPEFERVDGEIQEVNAAATAQEAGFEDVELVDVGADLTDDDKRYLAMKWGRLYRADEWVFLEQKYEGFMNSFDIQGEGRIETMKMICKTLLKMNQAIDCGDVDTYQKLSRVYDTMMKSAKFTAAQDKESKTEFVDSVGAMVAYCEEKGGQIPRYEIESSYDIIDTIIKDLKEYTKSLIYEDKALAQEIENYLKNKEIAEKMKKEREEARERGEEIELEDKDFQEFTENIQEQKQKDLEAEKEGVGK